MPSIIYPFCKSYTHIVDSQNIQGWSGFFYITWFYDRGGTPEEIYCGIKRGQKKRFKRNKKEYERLSDHIGFMPLVMVAPSDSELIRDGSEERRKFIDLVISQFDKTYLDKLIRYNNALSQRNSLLKQEVRMLCCMKSGKNKWPRMHVSYMKAGILS